MKIYNPEDSSSTGPKGGDRARSLRVEARRPAGMVRPGFPAPSIGWSLPWSGRGGNTGEEDAP